MPAKFCKYWKAEIGKHQLGWICGEKYAIPVSIHLSDTCNYLASGIQVAKKFAIVEPTKVRLEYTIWNNQFEITVLSKISNQKRVPAIIHIDDSDDEPIDQKNPNVMVYNFLHCLFLL
jgi:hypothetical protein